MYIGNVMLDQSDIRFIDYELSTKGFIKTMGELLRGLDATVVLADGGRPYQTGSFIYKWNRAAFIYILNNRFEIDAKTYKHYMLLLEELEKKNIEYEKENPPIDYGTTKKKRTTTKKAKATITDMFDGTKKELTRTGKLKEIRTKNVSGNTVQFGFGIVKPK